MKRKNSLIARILALLALVGAGVAVVVVVNSETGDDEPAVQRKTGGNSQNQSGGQKQQPTKKVYVVQEGDTLTVIARENGVAVAKIENLNPDVDPQALIPGQKLKLR
jgi:LysM repeat protein